MLIKLENGYYYRRKCLSQDKMVITCTIGENAYQTRRKYLSHVL